MVRSFSCLIPHRSNRHATIKPSVFHEAPSVIADGNNVILSTISTVWSTLTESPQTFADGDADTQLNESQVDSFVANNGYLTGATDTDDQTLSLSGSTLSIADGNNVILSTISTVWSNITGIPSDIADGDADTQLNESQVDSFVANNGYLTSYTETDPSFQSFA